MARHKVLEPISVLSGTSGSYGCGLDVMMLTPPDLTCSGSHLAVSESLLLLVLSSLCSAGGAASVGPHKPSNWFMWIHRGGAEWKKRAATADPESV